MTDTVSWTNKICPKCVSLTMVQNPRQVNFCERCGTKLEVPTLVEGLSIQKSPNLHKTHQSKSRCKTCGSLLITDWGGNKCIHCNRDEILDNIKEIKDGDKVGKYTASVL